MKELAVFFKAKTNPDDFANYLLREHEAIFGRSRLDRICEQVALHFRDEPSYIEAFDVFQAFGLYSIADGVRTQCGHNLRTVILTSLNKRFAVKSGPKWEMMRHHVTEYEEFGDRAPIGGFAAQRIFDRPAGVVQPTSKEAYDLSHVLNTSYLDAVKAIERLFTQFKFDVPTG
jgi:hypothetical protein